MSLRYINTFYCVELREKTGISVVEFEIFSFQCIIQFTELWILKQITLYKEYITSKFHILVEIALQNVLIYDPIICRTNRFLSNGNIKRG
jgi:hypothetical protein